uniref:Uncharacterized protein n=1 Tax=Caenorhabditis japonica TaxID=281687 RepID=A0A8R1HVP1_CAEJA
MADAAQTSTLSVDSEILDEGTSSPTTKKTKIALKRTRKSARLAGGPAATTSDASVVLTLMNRITKLENFVIALSSKFDAQERLIKELTPPILPTTNSLTANPPSKKRTCALYADIVKSDPLATQVSARLELASSLRTLDEKSVVAVLENLPDNLQGNQSISDNNFLDKLCASCPLLPKPVLNFRVKCVSPTVVSRPTKVKFSSQSDRDTFIRTFSKALREFADRPAAKRPIRVRRDMTRDELTLLRSLRNKCFEANQKAGEIRYFVRDLEIVQLSNPRPFPSYNVSAAPGQSA